jgi:transcription elongation factor GreA
MRADWSFNGHTAATEPYTSGTLLVPDGGGEECGLKKKGRPGMSEKEVLLSLDGLKQLEQELFTLRTVKRMEVAERIKQAREYGDIAENSEYEDAKNEQAFIEGRILVLEKTLRNAVVIDDHVAGDKVVLGSSVILKDLEYQDELSYTIVGTLEADPTQNRISNESPVGRAIMGKGVGAIVEVDAPDGTIKYEIIAVK